MDDFFSGVLWCCGFAAGGLFIALIICGVMLFREPRPEGKEAKVYRKVTP